MRKLSLKIEDIVEEFEKGSKRICGYCGHKDECNYKYMPNRYGCNKALLDMLKDNEEPLLREHSSFNSSMVMCGETGCRITRVLGTNMLIGIPRYMQEFRVPNGVEIMTYLCKNKKETYRSKIKHINVPDSVYAICSSTFMPAITLEDISADSVAKIGYRAFDRSDRIQKASFKNVDAIGEQAFLGCRRLAEFIGTPRFIGKEAFYMCYDLKVLDLSKTKVIESLALQGIDWPISTPLNMSSLERIAGDAFSMGENLLREAGLPASCVVYYE